MPHFRHSPAATRMPQKGGKADPPDLPGLRCPCSKAVIAGLNPRHRTPQRGGCCRHDMGLILDFVPNHMAVGGADSSWWLDVLEWGWDSPFAEYFDINWQATRPDLKERVLLPILGDQYGVVLENGEIEVRFDAELGSFSAWYFTHRLPISPHTYPSVLTQGGKPLAQLASDFGALSYHEPLESTAQLNLRLAEGARDPAIACAIASALTRVNGRKGQPESFLGLHRLLEAQAYRIADWRAAAEEINYP